MRTGMRSKVFEAGKVIILSLLGMLLALSLFSRVNLTVSAFELLVQVAPLQRGETVIYLPPVGEVRAATHRLPLQLQITLLNLDPALLEMNLNYLSAPEHLSGIKEEFMQALFIFLMRTTVISFIGAAGAIVILTKKLASRRVLWGGITGAVAFLLLFYFSVALPYQADAFNRPQFKGLLGAAPWVINLVGNTLDTVKEVGRQLELITTNLHDLAGQLEEVQLHLPDTELRVLHVSDIHNNPAAFDFIERVVDTFEISLVIDTGDITDYGTPAEAELLMRIGSLKVPYLFVPGNHDSPRIIEAMREVGAQVIIDELVEISGLKIAGLADPASQSLLMEVAPAPVLRAVGERLYDELKNSGQWPDLVAAHNSLISAPFAGQVPVILNGHNHRAEVRFEENTAFINAGTTGASGLRGLKSPGDNPYSLVILYFNRDEENGSFSMVMADLISVQQFQDAFTLQRFYNRLPSTPLPSEGRGEEEAYYY